MHTRPVCWDVGNITPAKPCGIDSACQALTSSVLPITKTDPNRQGTAQAQDLEEATAPCSGGDQSLAPSGAQCAAPPRPLAGRGAQDARPLQLLWSDRQQPRARAL